MVTLTAIAGPMFSGKSEELIRRLHRAAYAGKKIIVVKPYTDTRTNGEIASRRAVDTKVKEFAKSGSFPAIPIRDSAELEELIKTENPDLLGIDEIQFFDPWLIDSLAHLLSIYRDSTMEIVAAGLDLDYRREPFGPMPQILAMADKVIKLSAVCFVPECSNDAQYTQRLTDSTAIVEVGDIDKYEARCRICHTIPGIT